MNNVRDIIIGVKNTAFNSNKLNNNKNSLLIEPFKTTNKYFSNLVHLCVSINISPPIVFVPVCLSKFLSVLICL